MTVKEIARRLRALEMMLKGSDYVRNQDEADEAERLEAKLAKSEEKQTDSEVS